MKLIESYMAETVQPFRQHMQQEHFTKLNNTLFYDLFPLFVRQKRCIFRYPFHCYNS